MSQRICITTSSFDLARNPTLALLQERGWAVELNPFGVQLSEGQAIEFIRGCDPEGVIAGVEPWTRAVMEAAPSLRAISRLGAGVENVDFEAAEALGISVRATPDAPAPAVAELTLGLILAGLRKVAFADRKLREGAWIKVQGPLLADKTVAVVGYGRIGRRVAELCAAFGAVPVPYDPATAPGDLFSVLARADIVTLHLPLNAATRHLIGPHSIARMKEGAFLVNVARGGLVDEEALYEALACGRLAGGALDVFEREPYDGPLKRLDNVLLTPHIGSAALEVRRRMELEATANLVDALKIGEA